MKQLVSILVPAFNAGKWIRDCLGSALAQTWPRKEIIVVDDASRDATFEIARSFASANVQVVRQDNRGACSARNNALSLAQGDYIQWLDADDLLAPNKISHQLYGAEPGGVSRILLSGSWGQFYTRPQRTRFVPTPLWEDLTPVEWLFRKVDGNFWMAIESWLVSRKLTEVVGPWNEALSLDDDGEYFCRVVSCSQAIRFIPEARCFCRRGSFGISHALTLNDPKLDSQWASLRCSIQTLRTMEDKPRTRAACLKLLSRWSIYFYPERANIWEQMQSLSMELGQKLSTPQLRRKYRWVQKLLGWRAGKTAQRLFPTLRSFAEENWERLCVL